MGLRWQPGGLGVAGEYLESGEEHAAVQDDTLSAQAALDAWEEAGLLFSGGSVSWGSQEASGWTCRVTVHVVAVLFEASDVAAPWDSLALPPGLLCSA